MRRRNVNITREKIEGKNRVGGTFAAAISLL